MKYESRIEIRVSSYLKKRLMVEAKCCEQSLNTYLIMVLNHRKRVKVNVPSEKGYYVGY